MSLIRVLIIPKSSGNFCFGGGNQQIWTEVDWFRDDTYPLTDASKESLIAFIKNKKYFDKSKAYLVLHPQISFTIGYDAP